MPAATDAYRPSSPIQSIRTAHRYSPEIPSGLNGAAGSTDCANEFNALFIIGVDEPRGPCGIMGKLGNMLSGCGGSWPGLKPCGSDMGGLGWAAIDDGPLDLGVKSKAPMELSEGAGEDWTRELGGLPGVDPRSPLIFLLERMFSCDLFIPEALNCEAIEVMVRI